jgi:hypothetical protein
MARIYRFLVAVLVAVMELGCVAQIDLVEGPTVPTCREALDHYYEWGCWLDGLTREQAVFSCMSFDYRSQCVLDAEQDYRACLDSYAVEYDCHACDPEYFQLARCP